jgi:hypothetical protein
VSREDRRAALLALNLLTGAVASTASLNLRLVW